jgi:hypothetical protein
MALGMIRSSGVCLLFELALARKQVACNIWQTSKEASLRQEFHILFVNR